MIIRPMEPREVDSVIILFNYYRQAVGITDDDFDENRLLQTIREYSIRPNLFFRIACLGQRPIGVIGGFLSEDPVEREVTATIQFNYLLDDYADLDNYQQLISEFQAWAESLGVKKLRAIDIGYRIDRLESVYDQLDFAPIRVTVMNKEIA